MYKAKLHAGEVDVMILAQADPKADLVIIDDNAAKNSKISWINSNGHLRCSYKS